MFGASEFALCGPVENPARLRAPGVAKSFSRPECGPSIAHGAADGVGTIVSIQPHESTPVVDIAVDGAPEFFASGILVHNCNWEPLSGQQSPDRLDALVWALTELFGITTTSVGPKISVL